MVEHPNVAIIRQGFHAFSKGEIATLLDLLSENAIWHSPGKNPLSGDYEGRHAILEYFAKFAKLSQGTFRTELHNILATENHGVAITRDTAKCNGKIMSWDGAVIFRLEDGKLTEAWAMNQDQEAVDEFWS